MLDVDEAKEPSGLISNLRDSAEELVTKLESGDYSGASSVIEEIKQQRDSGIYREVGRLTRGLHDAISNFHIDVEKYGGDGEEESEMVNARDRLDYVITMTQEAADKTMDMVEEGIPVATNLSQEAAILQKDWGRLIRREMDPSEFRDLYQRIDLFLAQANTSADGLNEKFNNILMAQGYQDLTGQVIKKVISLVQEVEERLVDLVRVAGEVEEITGIVRSTDEIADKPKKEKNNEAEGPQINAANRSDVVAGQDDVDDLLSSLGF